MSVREQRKIVRGLIHQGIFVDARTDLHKGIVVHINMNGGIHEVSMAVAKMHLLNVIEKKPNMIQKFFSRYIPIKAIKI